MRRFIIFCLIVLIHIFILNGCYNDNEEDIYIKFNSSTCDTTNVNYTENMKYFFDSKCASCHDGSHPTCNLNNFENSHQYAMLSNTNLYTYMSNNVHKNCILTECENKQLKLWIENGAQ